jgi:hypothetical protein
MRRIGRDSIGCGLEGDAAWVAGDGAGVVVKSKVHSTAHFP